MDSQRSSLISPVIRLQATYANQESDEFEGFLPHSDHENLLVCDHNFELDFETIRLELEENRIQTTLSSPSELADLIANLQPDLLTLALSEGDTPSVYTQIKEQSPHLPTVVALTDEAHAEPIFETMQRFNIHDEYIKPPLDERQLVGMCIGRLSKELEVPVHVDSIFKYFSGQVKDGILLPRQGKKHKEYEIWMGAVLRFLENDFPQVAEKILDEMVEHSQGIYMFPRKREEARPETVYFSRGKKGIQILLVKRRDNPLEVVAHSICADQSYQRNKTVAKLGKDYLSAFPHDSKVNFVPIIGTTPHYSVDSTIPRAVPLKTLLYDLNRRIGEGNSHAETVKQSILQKLVGDSAILHHIVREPLANISITTPHQDKLVETLSDLTNIFGVDSSNLYDEALRGARKLGEALDMAAIAPFIDISDENVLLRYQGMLKVSGNTRSSSRVKAALTLHVKKYLSGQGISIQEILGQSLPYLTSPETYLINDAIFNFGSKQSQPEQFLSNLFINSILHIDGDNSYRLTTPSDDMFHIGFSYQAELSKAKKEELVAHYVMMHTVAKLETNENIKEATALLQLSPSGYSSISDLLGVVAGHSHQFSPTTQQEIVDIADSYGKAESETFAYRALRQLRLRTQWYTSPVGNGISLNNSSLQTMRENLGEIMHYFGQAAKFLYESLHDGLESSDYVQEFSQAARINEIPRNRREHLKYIKSFGPPGVGAAKHNKQNWQTVLTLLADYGRN